MIIRNFYFYRKNIISKTRFLLGLFFMFSVLSCTTMQYGLDAKEMSRFSNFDNLGIKKEEFITKYGAPTSKALYQEAKTGKIEKLYYTEQVKSFFITTEFVFENNSLEQMNRIENYNNFFDARKK